MNYRKRRNVSDKSECEWRTDDDALTMRDAGGVETRYLWKDLKRVQVSFAPTQLKPWRHRFVLGFRGQPPLEIDNAHFKGVGEFEDRSSTYAPFVREALAKIAVAAPNVRLHAGYGVAGYAFSILFVAVSLTALLLVVFLLPIPLGAWPVSALIKFGIVLLMLPLFFRWLRRARPRDVPIAAIPDDALPKPLKQG